MGSVLNRLSRRPHLLHVWCWWVPWMLRWDPPKYKSCRQPTDARHVVAIENYQESSTSPPLPTRATSCPRATQAVSTPMTTSCWVQEHGLPARRRRGTVSFAPCLHDLQGDVQGLASDLVSGYADCFVGTPPICKPCRNLPESAAAPGPSIFAPILQPELPVETPLVACQE